MQAENGLVESLICELLYGHDVCRSANVKQKTLDLVSASDLLHPQYGCRGIIEENDKDIRGGVAMLASEFQEAKKQSMADFSDTKSAIQCLETKYSMMDQMTKTLEQRMSSFARLCTCGACGYPVNMLHAHFGMSCVSLCHSMPCHSSD